MAMQENKLKEYTKEDIAKIKRVVKITLSDLLLIPEELPKHLSYTAVLGAMFSRALATEEEKGQAVTPKLIKKVVNHLKSIHQSRVVKYTRVYAGVIDSIIAEASKEIDDKVSQKDASSVKDIDAFNVCMNGLAVVKPQAMTTYFDKLFEGESEYVTIEAPLCTKGSIVFLPSEESARRVSIFTNAFVDYPSQAVDINLILSYATTRILLGGYEDEDFIDRVDADFFDAIKDGMYAAKIINYFAPMIDSEFDSMSKTFFS